MKVLLPSDQTTLGAPLWPLKLLCVVFLAFRAACILTRVHLSSQKVISEARESSPAICPWAPRALCQGRASSRARPPSRPPGPLTLKAVWSVHALVPRKVTSCRHLDASGKKGSRTYFKVWG